MIDTQLLGQTAAKCMDSLEGVGGLDEGRLTAVAIIVICEDAEGGQTFTRTYMSDTHYYKQLGIIYAGLECLQDGTRFDPDDADDEGEERTD